MRGDRGLALLMLAGLACHEPTSEQPVFVGVVAKPCALDIEGRAHCWSSPTWPEAHSLTLDSEATPVVSLQSEQVGVLRGLDADGEVVDLACLDLPYDTCPAVEGPLQTLTDWGGLRTDGTLVADVHHDAQPLPGRAFGVVADDVVAGIDRSGELWMRDAPDLTLSAPRAVSLVANVAGDQIGACALDAQGTIHCAGTGRWAEPFFTDPPYRLLDGAFGAACAVKGAGTVVCNDGTVREWDTVVAIAAAAYPGYGADGRLEHTAEISVCAVIDGGGLLCEGPRFPGDLLATVP